MKIGIDGNCLLFEQAGVGKYAHNLIKTLLVHDRRNSYYVYFFFVRGRRRREKMVRSLLGATSKRVHLRFIRFPAAWYEFLMGQGLPCRYFIKDRLDVFFAPYPTGIPKNCLFPMVTTIHDLTFCRYPEHRGRKLSRYYLKRHKIAAKICAKLIVPSEATDLDVRRFLVVPAAKIKKIPEAADERFRKNNNNSATQAIIARYFDPKIRYFLSVGTLEPRKNLSRLVSAYAELPHHIKKQYKLVLVGAQGWNNQELGRIIKNLNLQKQIILTGFVKDLDLPYIYNKASIFIYPSLFEGFGLPLLEAMACQVPVIAGNHSSLPEVAGHAAILVDTQNEAEIARAIKMILDNPRLARKLVKLGLVQTKKLTWKKVAVETLKVLESVGGDHQKK